MDTLNVKSLPRCDSIDLSAVTPSFLLSMPLGPLIESSPFLLFLAAFHIGAWYGALLPGAPLQRNTDQNF